MKSLIIVSLLIILGIYLFRKMLKRKYPQDNLGRRSGQHRRKTFVAKKKNLRRSDIDRRNKNDRRRLFRNNDKYEK